MFDRTPQYPHSPMYFRLTDINGTRLPTSCMVGPVMSEIGGGGLLLEPPDADTGGVRSAGQSTIRLLGTGENGDFLGSSSESYNWSGPGLIQIGHTPLGREVRFSGVFRHNSVEITSEGTGRFLPIGTKLRFVSAPNEPIPDSWKYILYYGPPIVQFQDGQPEFGELVQQHMSKWIEEQDRLAKIKAVERIERAWRAPP